MRLLIVGTLDSRLATATKLAMNNSATVAYAADIAQTLSAAREGRVADLLVVDTAISIPELVRALEAEHIDTPIVACGTATDARAAAAAVSDGAKGYIPLPTDPELIAAVLAAVADDKREPIYWDDATAGVIRLAQQIASNETSTSHAPLASGHLWRALVGRTVAEVERDLILETLKHCGGNRTHTANLLGISIRTLRNKLSEYTAAGVSVTPPGGGVSSESRAAA